MNVGFLVNMGKLLVTDPVDEAVAGPDTILMEDSGDILTEDGGSILKESAP